MREQQGLRQCDLGVDIKTVSQMELGNRSPKLESMQKIARSLGSTVEEINAEVDRLNGIVADGSKQGRFGGYSPHQEHHQLLDAVLSSKRKGADIWQCGISAYLMLAATAISSNCPLNYELWEKLFPYKYQERK
jgi:transcriptional regulator with XRE-family HTH domain